MKKILLFAIILILNSCSRGTDNPIPTPTPIVKKINTVNKDGNLFYKIYYDTSGKTTGNDYFSNGALQQRTTIEYTGGLQTKYNFYDATNTLKSYHVYSYQNNLITKREIYTKNTSGQFILSQYIDYTNDVNKTSNNLMSAKYYNSTGAILLSYNITYTDNLGSSITDNYNASNIKTSVSTWVKDDKISWDKVLDPFTYQHEHNNISVSDKNISTGVATGYTAAFTYDSNGYPLTAKYNYTDGTIANYTFIWE